MAPSRRLLALALAWLALPAAAAEIDGRAQVVSARSGRAARGVDLSELVVAFVPRAATPVPAPGTFSMATAKKSFVPSSLVVPVGSTVVFPNHDPILHNVFSLTPGSAFDLGLYGRGEGKSAVFSAAGLVKVFCNVHHDMVGHIFVVDGPFFSRANEDGSFRLAGLPAGPGRLLAWHPRSDVTTVDVPAPASGLALTLEALGRRIPSHLNKFGKPYRSRRDRYNR